MEEMVRAVDRSHIMLGNCCQLPPHIKNAGTLPAAICIQLVKGGALVFDFCCRCCGCCCSCSYFRSPGGSSQR